MGIDIIDSGVDGLNNLLVQGIHLGVKFETENTIAQIHEGCILIGLNLFAVCLQACQGDDIGTRLDGFVFTGSKIVEKASALLNLIKRGMTGCQHFADIFGDEKSILFHFVH